MSSALAMKTVPLSLPPTLLLPIPTAAGLWGAQYHMNPVFPPTHFDFNFSFHLSVRHFFCISSCSREQQSTITQSKPHGNRYYSQNRPQRNENLHWGTD